MLADYCDCGTCGEILLSIVGEGHGDTLMQFVTAALKYYRQIGRWFILQLSIVFWGGEGHGDTLMQFVTAALKYYRQIGRWFI